MQEFIEVVTSQGNKEITSLVRREAIAAISRVSASPNMCTISLVNGKQVDVYHTTFDDLKDMLGMGTPGLQA